jgi:hypothetical protein
MIQRATRYLKATACVAFFVFIVQPASDPGISQDVIFSDAQ